MISKQIELFDNTCEDRNDVFMCKVVLAGMLIEYLGVTNRILMLSFV